MVIANNKIGDKDFLMARRKELMQRSSLLQSPNFRGFIEAKAAWHGWAMNKLRTQRLDPYDQGWIHGVLEVLDDLCLDEEGISRKIQEIDAKITRLEADLESAETRRWREPPPSYERPAPPTSGAQKPGLRLDVMAPQGGTT